MSDTKNNVSNILSSILFWPAYICSRDVESGLSSIYLSYVAHTSYMWTNSKNRKRTRIVVGTCDTNRTRKATEIFPTGYLCSQARERIPLGEQTRTDLRWPKANRVVGSERMKFYISCVCRDRQIKSARRVTQARKACVLRAVHISHIYVLREI